MLLRCLKREDVRLSENKQLLLNDLATLIVANEATNKELRLINNLQAANQGIIEKGLKKQLSKTLLLPLIIIFAIAAFPIPIINPLLYFIFPSSVILLIMVVLLVAYLYSRKALKNKNSKFRKSSYFGKLIHNIMQQDITIQNNNQRIAKSKQVISEIQQELYNQGIFERIPKQYTTPKAVIKMFTYVYNQRADTLKEAINLFEQEEHQERMEQKQDAILRASERAEVEARAARINAAIAAASAEQAVDYAKGAAASAQQAATAASAPKEVTVRVRR